MSNPDAFYGRPVVRREVVLAGRRFVLDGVDDAAELLEVEAFARRFEETDAAPYGLELWPAATHLAAAVLAGPDGAGRRALELGCGLGLVSIAAARRGWTVTATDHDEHALRFCVRNAGLNGVGVDARPLDWTTARLRCTFELILAADVLYEQRNHAPVARCIAAHLDETGRALVADPNRTVADPFADAARAAGLHVDEHPYPAGAGLAGRARLFDLRTCRPGTTT